MLGAQCTSRSGTAQFGFTPDGADYDEDGIPHLPMRLRRAAN